MQGEGSLCSTVCFFKYEEPQARTQKTRAFITMSGTELKWDKNRWTWSSASIRLRGFPSSYYSIYKSRAQVYNNKCKVMAVRNLKVRDRVRKVFFGKWEGAWVSKLALEPGRLYKRDLLPL